MADKFTLKDDAKSQFSPHPEGQFPAVCVDFIDLGEKVEQFEDNPAKLVYKVALVWQTGEANEAGRLHEVSAEFTASMGDRANLRKVLEDWRGKSYSKDELKAGIPADKLVGRACLLTVEHKDSRAGRTYAKVRGIAPLPKGLAKPEVPEYTRPEFWAERKREYAEGAAKFRKATTHAAVVADHDSDWENVPPAVETDDGLPF